MYVSAETVFEARRQYWDTFSSQTHRGPRAQHVFKAGSGTQEIQRMLIKMTKENLQSKNERNAHSRPLEVRLSHSSDEVSENSWSEGDSKKWIGFNFLAPFSEKTEARQR